MKIAVVGSRDWPKPAWVVSMVERIADRWPDATIISGGARGVDSEAERGARIAGLAFEAYHAEWERYGRGAGYKRNETLVELADRVVAFWDGESRGTKHSIDLALKLKKNLEVIFP